MRSMVEGGERGELFLKKGGFAAAPPPAFGWSPSPRNRGEDLKAHTRIGIST